MLFHYTFNTFAGNGPKIIWCTEKIFVLAFIKIRMTGNYISFVDRLKNKVSSLEYWTKVKFNTVKYLYMEDKYLLNGTGIIDAKLKKNIYA